MQKLFGLFFLILAFSQMAAAGAGHWSSHAIQTRAGALDYQVYLPAPSRVRYNGAILGLHGCHETAKDFAELAKLPELADREGLVLVVPEQSPILNPDLCWNWFLPINQARFGGEPEQFVLALQEAVAGLEIPKGHNYVIGLSSGAILANVMGSCYPDVFSGVAIHSGVQYAESLKPADAADGSMRCPLGSAAASGGLAFSCSGLAPRKLPKVILFHGDTDARVYPCNEGAIFDQWVQAADWSDDLQANGSVSSAGATIRQYQPLANTHAYTVTDLVTPHWQAREVLVQGMAHAWSGGAAGMSYGDPLGPDATEMFWEFFQR